MNFFVGTKKLGAARCYRFENISVVPFVTSDQRAVTNFRAFLDTRLDLFPERHYRFVVWNAVAHRIKIPTRSY